MTTFSFSTGNPSNLTGGATASMTDISGSLSDIKTFLNAATITDTNVQAAGLTDTSLASPTNGVWRTVLSEHTATVGINTGTWFYNLTASSAATGSAQGGVSTLWVPPTASDIAVAGKTTRLRIRVPYLVNATAPGINLTWALYPITSVSGGAGAIGPTVGTAIAASAAVATAPTTAGVATGASFDFSAVTGATAYLIGVTGSGTMNASAYMATQLILEMRHT